MRLILNTTIITQHISYHFLFFINKHILSISFSHLEVINDVLLIVCEVIVFKAFSLCEWKLVSLFLSRIKRVTWLFLVLTQASILILIFSFSLCLFLFSLVLSLEGNITDTNVDLVQFNLPSELSPHYQQVTRIPYRLEYLYWKPTLFVKPITLFY